MNPPPFTAPALESLSRLLPAFDFKALIASNDFSAVYLAGQRSLDRDVAVKVLAPHTSADPGFRQSFETTARMMAKLNHPNLIGVFDSGYIEGMIYFVMEFVPGKSLERSSRGQCVEVSQAVRLIEGIAEGLAHAHEHGIVHGGLTAADILLNQKAEPKLGNFGFNQPAQTSAARADHRADVLAAGSIFYELLTARPHSPDARPPSELSACGPALDAVWRQATHPDPRQRFQDMRSFLKSLADSRKKPGAATPPASQGLASKATGPLPAKAPPEATPPLTGPTPKPTQARQSVGVNWTLIRNLVIIAGLLYAISLAWDFKKQKTAERERHNREILAEAEARKEQQKRDAMAKAAAEREKALAEARSRQAEPSLVPDSKPPTESADEALARLRNALASGDRSEMPAGSVRQGDFHYLLVKQPMSWPEATTFAELHGGHLAIPGPTADLSWLVGTVAAGEGVWIGAARSGRQEWTLVDGLSWKPKKEPSGIGAYLAVDRNGFLRAEGPKRSLPFIIQWRQDGTNPGTLAALLEKTAKSLSRPNPVFPPGTQAVENRRYLFVSRPMRWREAVDLAKTSGGHLAVTSEVGEIAGLLEMVREINAPDGIWLGGFLKNDRWLWITGEPWKTAKWAPGTTNDSPDSALTIQPGKGWQAKNLGDRAAGFIIEWSNDNKSASAASDTSSRPPVADSPAAPLLARAKELLAAAERKRSEQLIANSRRFTSELDVYLRNLPKGERQLRETQVTLLKSSVKNNRVPSAVPLSSGVRMSQEMAEIAQGCAEKQDRIDADFLAEVEKIRPAFVTKIQEALTEAKQAGQTALTSSLADTLETARKPKDWVSSLGFVLQPENPPPPGRIRPGGNNGGNFRIQGTGRSLVD